MPAKKPFHEEVREQFTVIKLPKRWAAEQVRRIFLHMRKNAFFHWHGEHPRFLVLHGVRRITMIRSALGTDDFEYGILRGLRVGPGQQSKYGRHYYDLHDLPFELNFGLDPKASTVCQVPPE